MGDIDWEGRALAAELEAEELRELLDAVLSICVGESGALRDVASLTESERASLRAVWIEAQVKRTRKPRA